MYIVLDRDLLKTTKAINAIKSINSIKIMKTIKAMKAIKANILLSNKSKIYWVEKCSKGPICTLTSSF